MKNRKTLYLIISIGLSVLILVSGLIVHLSLNKKFDKQKGGTPSKLMALNENTTTAPVTTSVTKSKKDIITECQKQVFFIEVDTDEGMVTGSGFLYNNDGDIVTNAHVVEGASKVKIRLSDSKTEYFGTVIGRGADLDVALVRVPELSGTQPLKIAKDRKAQVGDEVIALGSPLGYQNTATIGIISGLDRNFKIGNFNYNKVYQISAPISPGSSGGPLIDGVNGEVLGINSAYIDQGSIGFSIPIYQCVTYLDKWAANPGSGTTKVGTSAQKLTGTELTEVSKELVKYLYGCITTKDYATAYLLWGIDWKTKTNYDTYKSGFKNTDSVSVETISAVTGSDGAVKVNGTISAKEKVNGTTVTKNYKVTYLVGYENGVLKILDGSAVTQ